MPHTPIPEKAKQSVQLQKVQISHQSGPSQHHQQARPGYLGGGDGLAHASTTLSGVQAVLTTSNSLGLLDDLLSLGEDKLDVAGVGHVGVDLGHKMSAQLLIGPHSDFVGAVLSVNVHDRGHGKFVGAAWGPG